jgi:hypothetical protein
MSESKPAPKPKRQLRDKIESERFKRRLKEADRLIRDPMGIMAIEKLLNVTIYDDARPGRKTVAILIPTYNAPHPAHDRAMLDLVEFSKPTVDTFVVPREGKCVVHWARNDLIAGLLQMERPYDYVLFVDDDVVPEPDALVRLMKHEKDIVAGLCTRRTHPPHPNLRMRYEDGSYGVMLDWPNHGQLIPVDAIGTGMMLISRKAIEEVGEFYLAAEWERRLMEYMVGDVALLMERTDQELFQTKTRTNLDLISGKRRALYEKDKNAFWFQFLPRPEDFVAEHGEDVSFCIKAKLLGMEVFCDTAVQPGHMGDHAYRYRDFLPYLMEYRKRRKEDAEKEVKACAPEGSNDTERDHSPSGLPDGETSVETSRPESTA